MFSYLVPSALLTFLSTMHSKEEQHAAITFQVVKGGRNL
jgi:hypothetical protein